MRGLRVLLVDDNADSADGLGMLLELQGHEILIAAGFAHHLVKPFEASMLEKLLSDLEPTKKESGDSA